jgi:hypothetical protein
MDSLAKLASPFHNISKLSLKRRILIAAGLLAICLTVDILMFFISPHVGGGGLDLIILVFALLIILRPQWIDRWMKKTEKN